MLIRPENPNEAGIIRHIHDEAFGQPGEGRVLDALRENGKLVLSLVACLEEGPVAHVAFFPVTIQGEEQTHEVLGLGPMAVLPEFQNQGIGTALASEALERLRQGGYEGVIVLGHPGFYGDLGFTPASQFGITCSLEVPEDCFMAMELQDGGLAGKSGVVVYSSEFDVVL